MRHAARRARRFLLVAVIVTDVGCSRPNPSSPPPPDPCVARPEVCDGIDNDCDRTIDIERDGGPLTMMCPRQEGVCAGARVTCIDGGFAACGTAQYGAAWQTEETRCDGVDNDCDGLTDHLLDGGPIQMPCRLDAGVCAGSSSSCRDGGFPECGPDEYGPDWDDVETRCDGLDNDCDGVVDQSRWISSRFPYSVYVGQTLTPPYPSLFPKDADAGYVAQFAGILWGFDANLASEPVQGVTNPGSISDSFLFATAIQLRDDFVVMGAIFQDPQPVDNVAWRFGRDGKVRLNSDGGVDFWRLGPSPGLFTLAGACGSSDGQTFLAGTIPETAGPLVVMSIARDGGRLSSPIYPGASAEWSCAPSGLSGFVIATFDGTSTTLTEVDRYLSPTGASRLLPGFCAVEREDLQSARSALALCKAPGTLVRNLFDGGTAQPLSRSDLVALPVRTPGETLLAADLDLGLRKHELYLATPSSPGFRLVQTALSDDRIAVQGGHPGTVILMTDSMSKSTVNLSRLCYP